MTSLCVKLWVKSFLFVTGGGGGGEGVEKIFKFAWHPQLLSAFFRVILRLINLVSYSTSCQQVFENRWTNPLLSSEKVNKISFMKNQFFAPCKTRSKILIFFPSSNSNSKEIMSDNYNWGPKLARIIRGRLWYIFDIQLHNTD